MTIETKLRELRARLLEIRDLGWAGAVLSWDQATYMPPAGAPARARQLALLSRLEHERMTDPALGHLLDALAPYAGERDDDDARLIAVARRDFDKAIKVPASYVERVNALGSASYSAWRKARPSNDFASMRPYLENSLDLTREYVEFFAPYQHMADPLIDDVDEGLTYAAVRALFDQLRRELVPLVTSICNQAPADDSCLHGEFAERAQVEFGLKVATDFGYDLKRGRLDTTPHPFCTKFSDADVRITTRTYANELSQCLFSTLHEAGHALYEQGIAPELAGTPLGRGASIAVHESQSRLWENVVGRSRNFWQQYYPKLQQEFPEQLGKTPHETFYRAINKVARSLIRTDADEVTYNLHVMMRFDLEVDLLEGRLAVKDLPEAWRARIEAALGVAPPDDRDGCLQDVHWFSGGIGGSFQGYTIGNILGAQFFAAAVKAHPEIPAEIARGEFGTLHKWLTAHIYRHGRKFEPSELVERATGAAMSIAPYLAYLRGKYGELYRLPA